MSDDEKPTEETRAPSPVGQQSSKRAAAAIIAMPSLKRAATKLKAEALRRYRIRHEGYSDLQNTVNQIRQRSSSSGSRKLSGGSVKNPASSGSQLIQVRTNDDIDNSIEQADDVDLDYQFVSEEDVGVTESYMAYEPRNTNAINKKRRKLKERKKTNYERKLFVHSGKIANVDESEDKEELSELKDSTIHKNNSDNSYGGASNPISTDDKERSLDTDIRQINGRPYEQIFVNSLSMKESTSAANMQKKNNTNNQPVSRQILVAWPSDASQNPVEGSSNSKRRASFVAGTTRKASLTIPSYKRRASLASNNTRKRSSVAAAKRHQGNAPVNKFETQDNQIISGAIQARRLPTMSAPRTSPVNFSIDVVGSNMKQDPEIKDQPACRDTESNSNVNSELGAKFKGQVQSPENKEERSGTGIIDSKDEKGCGSTKLPQIVVRSSSSTTQYLVSRKDDKQSAQEKISSKERLSNDGEHSELRGKVEGYVSFHKAGSTGEEQSQTPAINEDRKERLSNDGGHIEPREKVEGHVSFHKAGSIGVEQGQSPAINEDRKRILSHNKVPVKSGSARLPQISNTRASSATAQFFSTEKEVHLSVPDDVIVPGAVEPNNRVEGDLPKIANARASSAPAQYFSFRKEEKNSPSRNEWFDESRSSSRALSSADVRLSTAGINISWGRLSSQCSRLLTEQFVELLEGDDLNGVSPTPSHGSRKSKRKSLTENQDGIPGDDVVNQHDSVEVVNQEEGETQIGNKKKDEFEEDGEMGDNSRTEESVKEENGESPDTQNVSEKAPDAENMESVVTKPAPVMRTMSDFDTPLPRREIRAVFDGDEGEEGSGDERGNRDVTGGDAGGENDDDDDEEERDRRRRRKPVNGMDPRTRGDEDEITSDEIVNEAKEKIPDDFYYDYAEHVSKAVITDDSGLPENLLTLYHSFGYDCMKRSNLCVLEKDTVAFTAGNFVEIVNLATAEHKYLRSTSGGGIGAITVHPSKKYIAVAEKGVSPNVNIYEYPSMKLYRILRGGTERVYSYIDFSPDGKLLASMGGDPDYMLTLWDWRQELIVLRSKAFSQDIFRVTFSTELEGQLTSAGIGHIRFWKMARTFTGLKLQGQLGKFGKKEISDIEGYVELPDGKVLSGSEWGNMLLWDGGLIKVEISRKGKKPCHVGPIQQILMDEGELMSIGVDGFVRVWDFESIDNADTTDEMDCFEMEPMNELKVGNDVQLRCMVKSCDPDEATIWYMQDASGGIWKLDLSFSFTSAAPERLMSYHSGPIIACGSSPVTHLVASIGVDCTVRIYDYISKTALCNCRYNMPGSALLWAPSIVDPKGATILTGFEDGVLRVLNLQKMEGTDEHGRKLTNRSELALRCAYKPHTAKITAIAIDSKGELLATGSTDSSVFFLSIGQNYQPIGFIKTSAAVTHISWSPASFKRNTLLVCCADGLVMEVEAPESLKDYDTSHTYEIKGLKIRTHQFKSVKSALRHEEELAALAKDEAEKQRIKEEKLRIRIERGILETETGEDAIEAPEEEPEEKKDVLWEQYIPAKPSTIHYGFHSNEEGKFWLSMGDYDCGYLYECEFLDDEDKKKKSKDILYEPIRAMPIHDSNDLPVRCLGFSRFQKARMGFSSTTSKHLFLGMDNGCIRIQPLHNNDPGLMGPFWSLTAHDNNYGKVTGVCSSFDDRFLFSVGLDGNFFAFEVLVDKAKEEEKSAKAAIPSAKKEMSELKVDDIADPKAYSIEDAKQKAEYDKMLLEAEEKKAEMRRAIQGLRDKFQELVNRNLRLPEFQRINKKEYEMDPGIKRELQNQKLLRIDVVKKEMHWEEAKHQLALNKLLAKFKDCIECEFITIKSFRTAYEVCSYRAPKLSEGFLAAKAALERKIEAALRQEMLDRQAAQAQDEADEKNDDGAGVEQESGDFKLVTSVRGSMGDRIIKALAKVEEKKKKRAARQAQWAELLASEPDPEFVDPVELAAMKEAEENMGDYKLKSASDYVVPDQLRMNTDKARVKLIRMKELIHQHKFDFNQRLLALRNKKIQNIEKISRLVAELNDVQSHLEPDKIKPVPSIPQMELCEQPEKKYEYTRETLMAFKEEMSASKEAATKTAAGSTLGGGGGGGIGGGGTSLSIVTHRNSLHGGMSTVSSTPSVIGRKGQQGASFVYREQSLIREDAAIVKSSPEALTELELAIKQREEICLLYKRDSLLAEIDEILTQFDAELRCLRHDKFALDVQLKNADIRHMVLFEELSLLKEYEKEENSLAAKVTDRLNEKADMQSKIAEATAKLELKKKEIEKLQEREKLQMQTFQESVSDNKFAEYLTKVYKKKIRRSKKVATEQNGGDDDSSESSDDDSEYSDTETESDSETGGLDLDVCPPGCDQSAYDSTCLMRDKRLDIEDQMAEEKKNRDSMIKDLDGLQKRAKGVDEAMKKAKQALEAFQLEKQQKLNELDTVVTLNLHQIEYIADGEIRKDLSKCLAFDAPVVFRLKDRIKELEHERIEQKRSQREAQKQHVQLIKDKRVFDQRINQLKEQTDQVMIDKFGRVVDVEKLEGVVINRTLEEVKARLNMAEAQCANDMLQWKDRLSAAKDEMTTLIRRNTELLDQLTVLMGEKKTCEHSLDSKQKSLGSGYEGVKKADIEERQRLIQLIQLQAHDIEALKQEIMTLSRKDGHVRPPGPPSHHQYNGSASNAGPIFPNVV